MEKFDISWLDDEAVERRIEFRCLWSDLDFLINHILREGGTGLQVVMPALSGLGGVTAVYVDGKYTQAAQLILEDRDLKKVA